MALPWRKPLILGLVAFGLPALAVAQGARLQGVVLDEDGEPIAGATVTLANPSIGPERALTTEKNGRWAVLGLEAGTWNVDFEAEGFVARKISVSLSALSNLKPLEIRLERAGPPPELVEAADKGDAAFEAGRFAEALEHYENLLALRPDLGSTLHVKIARCYKEEGHYEKEVEHLQAALDANPDNHGVRTLLAMEVMDKGETERGLELLAAVDENQIASPDVFYNIGVSFLNQGRQGHAIEYFTKAVERDPTYTDGFFQRGLAYFGLQELEKAKGDLQKVQELAPGGPQAETAGKVLEQLPD
jgi:tetratricopeptide (TPR) repeat protein